MMQNDLFRLRGAPEGIEAVLRRMHQGDPEGWRPRRALLQNWWLFSELEELHFGAGNLMLTGSNQSGKTTVLVALITLVMDRIFAPHRIDASGSGAKAVRYYLVGDEEVSEPQPPFTDEDRTGYVALEFQWGDEDRWITIGIALRARWKDGKSPYAWSFIVKNGQRLGHDFLLVDNVGRPLTPQALEKVLGSGGVVFRDDEIKKYQEAVNQEIFGFRDVDDFRKYLDILHIVRRPKLGDALTPESVSQMLVEALPRISAKPIDAASESFTRLDAIEQEITRLEEQNKLAEELDNLQIAYLEAAARAESHDLLTRLNEEAGAHRKHTSAEGLLAEARATVESAERAIEAIQAEEATLRGELGPLEQQEREHESYDARKQLDEAEAIGRQHNKELQALEGDQAQARGQREVAEKGLSTARTQWSSRLLTLLTSAGKFAALARDARWADLAERVQRAKSQIEQSRLEATDPIGADLMLGVVGSEANGRLTALARVAKAKEELEARTTDLTRDHEAKKRQEHAFNAAERALVEAETKVETSKDALVGRIGTWRDALTTLVVSGRIQAEIVLQIESWKQPSQGAEELFAPLRPGYQEQRQELTGRLEACTVDLAHARSTSKQIDVELGALQASTSAEPSRRKGTIEARRLLAAFEIPAEPLYAAIDFRDSELDQPARCRIEAALEDAGLLDALVVPHERSLEVKTLLEANGLADRWIMPTGRGEANSFFQPERLHTLAPADVIAALSSIGCGLDAPSTGAVSDDGSWRLGTLFGRAAASTEDVRYIGATNRARERARRIAEAEHRLAEAQAHEEAVQAEQAVLRARLEKIEAEWVSGLSLSEIRACSTALTAMGIASSDREKKFVALRLAREAEARAERQVEDARQNVFGLLIDAPWAELLTVADIRDVMKDLRRLQDDAEALRRQIADLDDLRTRFGALLQEITQVDRRARDTELRITEKQNHVASAEARILTLKKQLAETSLNHEELQERIRVIQAQLRSLVEGFRSHQEARIGSLTTIKLKSGEVEDLAEVLRGRRIERQIAEQKLENRLASYDSLDGFLQIGRKQGWTAIAKELAQEVDGRRAPAAAEEAKDNLNAAFHMQKAAFGGWSPRMDTERGLLLFTHPEGPMRVEELLRHLEMEFNRKSVAHNDEYGKIIQQVLLRDISRAIRDSVQKAEHFVERISVELRAMELFKDGVMQLKWEVRTPATKDAFDPRRLAELFSKSGIALASEDQAELVDIFSSMVAEAKRRSEAEGGSVDYRAALVEMLDYTKWYKLTIERKEGGRFVPLTRRVHGKGSEGRKALDLILPLMAAVRARLEGADPYAPRMIGFDEAFAGLDGPNSVEILRLLTKWRFSWVMATEKPLIYGDHLKGVTVYEFINDGVDIATSPSVWDGQRNHMFDQSVVNAERALLGVENRGLEDTTVPVPKELLEGADGD